MTNLSEIGQASTELRHGFIEVPVNGKFVQVPDFAVGYAFNQLLSMSDADIGFEDYVISVGMLFEEMVEAGFEFSQISCPPPKRDIGGSSQYTGNRPQSLAAGKSQLVTE